MAGYTTRSDNGEIIFTTEPPLVQILEADQTVTNSDTLVTVPAFSFPIGKYERYVAEYTIWFSTTASGDLKYIIDAPASPTLFRQVDWTQGGDATSLTTPAVKTAEASTSLTAAGAQGFLKLYLDLVNGATSGTVVFQFAQNTATASESAIVRAGSFVSLRKF